MNECFFTVVVDYDKLVDRIGLLVYIIVQNIWTHYRFVKKNHEVYFVSVTFYYPIHLMSNRQS
jgi:hypothetical protein